MAGGRFRRAATVAVAAAVTGIFTPFTPASASTAVSAPYTWEGTTWCPTFYASQGCNATEESGTGSSAAFVPSQVTYGGTSDADIYLRMNSAATKTGAFDTETDETWNAGVELSEQIYMPCNSSGQIDNWPAFWLDTTGSWPAGGEIDVVEGLHGDAAWHYHYLNSSGVDASVGGPVSGFSGCGTNTYAVTWTTSAITYYYNGTQVGQVTPAEIGVPLASGPMFVVNDYATSSTEGGPTTGNVKMEILSFTASAVS